MDFVEFPKIPRLSRDVVITEKIDGTNAQIYIPEPGEVLESQAESLSDNFLIFAGSRKRWITTYQDNMGFARWVKDNADELIKLGTGRHYGEWWGKGIQRGYGLSEKRFSLFNVGKWTSQWNSQNLEIYNEENRGKLSHICVEVPVCNVVPVIGKFTLNLDAIWDCLTALKIGGSFAAPGFMNPEGVVIYHTASGYLFKKTLEKDESPKSLVK